MYISEATLTFSEPSFDIFLFYFILFFRHMHNHYENESSIDINSAYTTGRERTTPLYISSLRRNHYITYIHQPIIN